MSDQSSLLFYPFKKGNLEFPETHSKTLFLNVSYVPDIEKFKNFDCQQFFKPYADVWQAHNVKVLSAFPSEAQYENIFCILPKQKEAALCMVAQSFDRLTKNGLLVCVAANKAGGKNIEKWIKDLGGMPTSLSKSKCRIVWAYKKDVDEEKIKTYIEKGSQQKITIGGQCFIAQPGIFGWNKIDKGSKLLIEKLPADLTGAGADFGCGYGYLSFEILKKYPKIEKLYALEADYSALSCAKVNLKSYEDTVDIDYGWVDLTQKENNITGLDWIIMNPPFHEGKQTCESIGQDFILSASVSLKKGGILYMVANAHLPYEKVLETLFSNVTKICEEQGYKVFMAQK